MTMTLTYTRVNRLGFNHLIRVDSRTLAVRAVQPGHIVYRGTVFPVVYVTGRVTTTGEVVRHTMPAGRWVIAAR
jgi:hypothetical protein